MAVEEVCHTCRSSERCVPPAVGFLHAMPPWSYSSRAENETTLSSAKTW